MKFENPGSEGNWFEAIKLRSMLRKRMTPLTPKKAMLRRKFVAGLYFIVATIGFHYMAFKHGIMSEKIDPIETALHHMDKGKILTFNNFKLEKVEDFNSADYENTTVYKKFKSRKSPPE